MKITVKERQEIIARCKRKNACVPEFERLTTAKKDEDFLKVLGDNISWCLDNKILDHKMLSKVHPYCNENELAGHNDLPAFLILKLSKSKDKETRDCITYHARTPAVVLTKLSKDKESLVRSSVAYNNRTPAAVLTALSKDPEYEVRVNVAYHPKTPLAVLSALSKDPEGGVRYTVANNPRTPKKTLEGMVNDAALDVWHSLSGMDLSEDALRVLEKRITAAKGAIAPYWSLFRLASNTACPSDVLERLTAHPNNKVMEAALTNKSLSVAFLKKTFETSSERTQGVILCNPSCPLSVWRKAAFMKGHQVFVASYKAPSSILSLLAKEGDKNIRLIVAGNADAPLSALRLLSKDANAKVRGFALKGIAERKHAQQLKDLERTTTKDEG